MVRFLMPEGINYPIHILNTPQGMVVYCSVGKMEQAHYAVWNPLTNQLTRTSTEERDALIKTGGRDVTDDRTLFVGTLQHDYWKVFPLMNCQTVVIRRENDFSYLTVAQPDEIIHGDALIATDCLTAAVVARCRPPGQKTGWIHTLIVFDL